MSKQYKPQKFSSLVRAALKKSRPEKIPIQRNLESMWRFEEKESFCRDISSLAEPDSVGLNNVGILSSFPYNGKDRAEKKIDLNEPLPIKTQGGITIPNTLLDDENLLRKFIIGQKKRWHNSKVGTKQDELTAIQALVLLEEKRKKYKELKDRKLLFKFQHEQAPSLSMRRCSLMPIHHAQVKIYASPMGYSFGGLATCNNPNCVRCSKKRAYKRRHRIQSSIEGARLDGKRVYFVTLTMKRSDDIEAQIKRMKKAWKAVQNKLDKVIKKKYKGTYATARAMDITFKLVGYGSHAPYNLHLHCVIIIDLPKFSHSKSSSSSVYTKDYVRKVEGLTDDKLSSMIKKSWCNSTGQSDVKGQDVQRVRSSQKLATYCAKMAGLAMELSSPHTKTGTKKNTLSLPQLMEKGIEGDQYAIKLYKKFLIAMKGMKTLSFSRNWDGYARSKEDEEEAEKESTPIVYIPHFWWRICKHYLDDIGLKIWKSIYLENEEDVTEFQGLMSVETRKEFEEWFGEDCSPDEEFKSWLNNI